MLDILLVVFLTLWWLGYLSTQLLLTLIVIDLLIIIRVILLRRNYRKLDSVLNNIRLRNPPLYLLIILKTEFKFPVWRIILNLTKWSYESMCSDYEKIISQYRKKI